MNRRGSAVSTPVAPEPGAPDPTASLASILERTNDSEMVRMLSHWGCAPPLGRFIVGPVEAATSNEAIVTMWDSHDSEQSRWPFRSLLRRAPRGDWQLCEIVDECLSCFGSGLVEFEMPCDTCDGSGWGVGPRHPAPQPVS